MEHLYLATLDDVAPADWDALIGPATPFAGHAWLEALERGGVAPARADWRANHLVLGSPRRPLAVAPCYLREGDDGEFVWNEPVRSAVARWGRPLGPRAVVTAPLTPVPGPRLLAHDARSRAQLAAAWVREGQRRGWASWHVHFGDAADGEALAAAGFFPRLAWQYVWTNPGHSSFDDYVDSLRRKRRNQVRRELRDFAALGLSIDFVSGPAAGDELLAEVAALVAATAERYGNPRPAVRLDFLRRVVAALGDAVVFGRARRGAECVAATFNVVHGDTLYGRTWGAAEPQRNLHFQLAYYAGIELCVARGLRRYHPGIGGEHKRRRGFEPELLTSWHRFADPAFHAAVRDWAAREGTAVQRAVTSLRTRTALRG